MADLAARPQVSIRRLAGHRIRVAIKRGAVITEATLTVAEAAELARKLNEYLGNGGLARKDAET